MSKRINNFSKSKLVFILILLLNTPIYLSQNIITNGDFELGSNVLCSCANSFTCNNDAGRVEDGIHPLYTVGNGGCMGGSNYTNSQGAHSGTGYVYFYAGLDNIRSSTINFATDTIIDLCVWYTGPQGSGPSGQNTNNSHFSFGIDGVQVGPDVTVPTNTPWTQFCYSVNVLAGNHTIDILSGGAAQYSIWFDDFSATYPCNSSFNLGPDTSICANDTLLLSAFNLGSTYIWQDSTTNSFYPVDTAGTYYVEVTSSCGVFSDTINISIENVSSPTIFTPNLWYCLGDNITTIISDSGSYWYDDVNLQNEIGTDSFYVAYEFLGTTTYYVVKESSNGCLSPPDSIQVTFENCTYPCLSNLIENGNFEEYSNCPNSQNQLSNLNNWEVFFGTPDYFNNCGIINYNQSIYPPIQNFIDGYLNTPNGDGYIHFMVNDDFGETSECFGQEVNLKKCVEYTIQFRMAHNQFHGKPNYDIGIYAGNTNSPSSSLYPEYELLATIESDSIELNWNLYSVTFSPSENFNYIAFAGVYPGTPDLSGEKSIFIDDLFLCEDTCANAPVDPVAFTLQTDYCGLSNGIATVDFTVNCAMIHDFEWKEASSGNMVSLDSIAVGLSEGTYNVTIADENGCEIASSVSIPAPPPSPSANVITATNCGQIVNFNADIDMQDFTLDSLLWTIPNEISSSQNSFNHTFINANTYGGNLILFADSICVFTFPFNVEVLPSITIDKLELANVITANNDGINDLFTINPLFENCSEFELKIYNRWGNLIFISTSSKNAFNGFDLNNNELKAGVYFYVLSSDQGEKSGNITIIK